MPKSSVVFKDIKSVEQLRDEIKVQAHLLKAEAKSEFEKMEKDWKVIKREIFPVRLAAQRSKVEIKKSTRELLHSLKSSYERMRSFLPTQKT